MSQKIKKNLRLKNKDHEEVIRIPRAKPNRNHKQNNMVLGMTLGNDLEDEEIEFTDEESMTSEENSDGSRSRSSRRGEENGFLKVPGYKKNGLTKGGLFGDGI